MKKNEQKELENALRRDYKKVEPNFESVFSKIEASLPKKAAPVPQAVSEPQPAFSSAGANTFAQNEDLSGGANGAKSDRARNKNNRAKKTMPIFAGVLAVLLAAVLLLILLFPKGTLPSITYGEIGYLVLDINPSVQIKLNHEGRVSEARPLNEDARTLLNSLSLVGLTDEDAAKAVLTAAQKLGYVSPLRKNNAVLVSASLTDKKSEGALTQKIKGALANEVKQKGIYCVVLTNVSVADSVKTEAERFGITEGKMRLIVDARKTGAVIADTEVATIAVAEIYGRMLAAAEKIEDSLPEALEDEYEKLTEQAEKLTEELVENIENAMDEISDLLEDDETAEAALERLEDLLELIENSGEEGLNMDGLFLQLNNELKNLAALASDNIRKKIEKIAADVQRETEKFNTLMQKAAEHFTNKREKLAQKTERETAGYEKETDFDKLYKDWLSEAELSYEKDWDGLKELWRKDLGQEYDD